MIRALYTAASGMTAQQLNVDNIANNLANANTAGFKMRRAQFEDLLYQNMVQPGTSAGQQTTVPVGLQLGLGTRPAGNDIILTQAISRTPAIRLISQSREKASSRSCFRPESSRTREPVRSSWTATETLLRQMAIYFSLRLRFRQPLKASQSRRTGRSVTLSRIRALRRKRVRFSWPISKIRQG